MQMSDIIWKWNACCTTTVSTLWICAEIIWIHSAVSEELRWNEIRPRFYPETIQPIDMQMRGVIWKWDVLDSSEAYPLLNSEDFIPNYPAIWQKWSNIENIINLINYANEWRNLKTKCMLHNYSLCSMDLWRNHLNPFGSFGGVAWKRNPAPILPWNNRAYSYMQTRQNMKNLY
jgi:hypothetical protein